MVARFRQGRQLTLEAHVQVQYTAHRGDVSGTRQKVRYRPISFRNCHWQCVGSGLARGKTDRENRVQVIFAPSNFVAPREHAEMDDHTKARIRELMFRVVPDPDETITGEVLARSEEVDYEEEERLKSEFRELIESLEDLQDVRALILEALDEMDASSKDQPGDVVEWMNVRDVMGRRIRKALAALISIQMP